MPWTARSMGAAMPLTDLIEDPPDLPVELRRLETGTFANGIEHRIASKVSGRHNAVLGVGTPSLLHEIALATCPAGAVYVIHPSDVLLNMVMDEVIAEGDVNVDVRRAPLSHIPAVNQAFDTVFELLQLRHEPDPVGFLREVRRVLAADGRLLVVETLDGGESNSHAPPTDGMSPSSARVEEWLARAGFLPVSKDLIERGFTAAGGSPEGSSGVLVLEARPVDGTTPASHYPLPAPAGAR